MKRMKTVTRAGASIGLLFFLFGLPPSGEGATDSVKFYYTANRQGEIDPCGCQTGQIGGLNRLAEFFKKDQRDPKHSLFVDSGDAFFALSDLPPSRLPQELAKAELIGRVYKELALDAYVPGRRDLAAGWKTLSRLAGLTGAPFLASNLEPQSEDAAFLRKHLIVNRGGRKIGLFGLVNSEDFRTVSGVAARDPFLVAKEEVRFLKQAKVDVIVVLSYLGLEKDIELAALPDINLIFGSRSLDVLAQPRRVGKTWVLQPDIEGRQVGVLDYSFSVPPTSGHRLVELDKKLDTKNRVYEWMEAHREFVRKLAFSSSHSQTTSGTPFVAKPFACKTCHRPQYDFWEKTNHAAAYLVLFSKNQHFNPQCIACHSLGFRSPEGFQKIAHPIELTDPNELAGKDVFAEQLMKAVFGKDIKPLDSRTEPDRYRQLHKRYTTAIQGLNEAAKLEKVYMGVQCEHCHGNRNGHPRVKTKGPKKVQEASCLQCHVSKHDPNFNFAKDVPKIACPKM